MLKYERPAASDERARIVEEFKQVEKELDEARSRETIDSLTERLQELSGKLSIQPEK